MFALITTDTLEGPDSYCVWSGFGDEEAAYLFAAGKLVEAGLVEFEQSTNSYWMDDQSFRTPQEVVVGFSESLDATEYFHVLPERPKS